MDKKLKLKNMKELNLTLTVNELNVVLEAMGNMPYARVFELINRVHRQASEQINSAQPSVAEGQTEV